MMNLKKVVFILAVVLAVVSCAKDDKEELPANFEGYTYLPLTVGQEAVFKIDSITYDDFTGNIDTTVYFIREVVQEQSTDLSGRSIFKVAVYTRLNDSASWRQIRIDEKHRGTYRYELKKNSISFVPLVFPPLLESRWNVNSLNNGEEITYRYESLHQSFSIKGNAYDSTITVLQKDILSLIGREYEREVYASGVGLVYQEQINLETDINTGNTTKGFERRMYRYLK